jgi:pseudouridine synthase
MSEERLQKVLAAAGVASRRACEVLISEGRVRVNGVVVSELGSKVDSRSARITVDGQPIRLKQRFLYIKVHKPRGVLSDFGGDEHAPGRQTVLDLLPNDMERVYPVGRLDLMSEGLVLLTNDGDLAHKLTHPRYHHPKTYFVLVADRPDELALQHLRTGVDLPEGERSAPARVRLRDRLPAELQLDSGPTSGVWLEIALHEGKKRQIRHMTAAVGHPTLRLVRWTIGSLHLGPLKVGAYVHLTAQEIRELKRQTDQA